MNSGPERRFRSVEASKTFRNIVSTFELGNKSVLDIGCSYGEFLIHFGEGSTGISLSHDEVAYGLTKGLDIRYGNVESDSFVLEKKHDVIFANNIFEHLYSPHHFLIKIRKYLKSEGILILGVPSIPKLVPLLHLRKFKGSLAAEHINFFTRDTLQKTVERGGWDVRMVRGFHFYNKTLDGLLDPVYPHFYVVAQAQKDFMYPHRRLRELIGYEEMLGEAGGVKA